MSEEKQGFCTNSNRWLVFMDASGSYPKSCWREGDCDNCGYFKERTPTSYLKRKNKLLKEAFCFPAKKSGKNGHC